MPTGADALPLFFDLARLVTPSGAEREATDHVAAYLAALGVASAEDAAGNLYARLPATADGTAIFLCAHVDTVPAVEQIVPVVVDGWVTNENAAILGADNKATVAAMLDAVRRVLTDGALHAGIELVLTVGEEVGLLGAFAFDASRLIAQVGFVYDHAGPLGGIVVAAPGQNSIELEFGGVAAHAGIAPEEGVSAIVAAARAVTAMRLGRIDEETTANVGIVEGGSARNVVPARCLLRAEVRSRSTARLAEETAFLLEVAATAAAESGCGLRTTVTPAYAAYTVRKGAASVRLARQALADVGIAARDERVGGGADAHAFVAAGLDCIVLTSGMELIHGPEERIRAADVDAMSDITVALIHAACPDQRSHEGVVP